MNGLVLLPVLYFRGKVLLSPLQIRKWAQVESCWRTLGLPSPDLVSSHDSQVQTIGLEFCLCPCFPSDQHNYSWVNGHVPEDSISHGINMGHLFCKRCLEKKFVYRNKNKYVMKKVQDRFVLMFKIKCGRPHFLSGQILQPLGGTYTPWALQEKMGWRPKP